jgi:CMP-N,N'-diacetyllegionaminic acid synthase
MTAVPMTDVPGTRPRMLAVIPARGGSKRLPGKNLKLLAGLPLIGWSILAARRSDSFDEVVVSTDDPMIASESIRLGARVRQLRPAHLATDTATMVDVVLHEIAAAEEDLGPVHGVVLLQPTSPFRSPDLIRRAVTLFVAHHAERSIVSMRPTADHPAWCFTYEESRLAPLLGWDTLNQRSQDLPRVWTLNGSIYAIAPATLRIGRSFIGPDTLPLFTNDLWARIDIDTEDDWKAAQAMLERRPTLMREIGLDPGDFGR